jgi:hypothetical protein
MKQQYFTAKDLLYIAPVSLGLGAGLASMEPGSWWVGFTSFSLLFLLSFSLLNFFLLVKGGRALRWIVPGFLFTFGVRVGLHVSCPLWA